MHINQVKHSQAVIKILSEVGHGNFFIRLDLLSGSQDEVVLEGKA